MNILNFLNLKAKSKKYLNMIRGLGHENIVKIDGDTDTYFIYKEAGVCCIANQNNIIIAIQIYSEGKDGYIQYSNDIPNNIQFNFLQEDIKKILGNASRSGGGYNDKNLGYITPWDSYYFNTYTMHISYKGNRGAIEMITFMPPDLTPGKS